MGEEVNKLVGGQGAELDLTVSSQKVGRFEPCESFRSLRSELGLDLRKVLPPDY